jgi:putative transposase
MEKFSKRRLKGHSYSGPGCYFVTICTDFKKCTFGNVKQGRMQLSKLGEIAEESWLALARQFPRIRLHEHIVMPNHVHGIIEFQAQIPALLSQRSTGLPVNPKAHSLAVIVRSYKADVTRKAHWRLNWNAPIWQHNFYDHVIRDGRDFSNASRYIAENPLRWQASSQLSAAGPKHAQQAAPLQRIST